jgi:hypothetical protein
VQTKNEKNEIKLTITQERGVYDLPLEMLITRADGSTLLHTVQLKDRETVVKIESKGGVKVTLDPDKKLLFEQKK